MKATSGDTIAAVSSPLGQAGIGVIRMSGPESLTILSKIFRPRKKIRSFPSRRLQLGYVFDPGSGKEVDEVFAVYMEQPRTYTREDMAEVYSHAGLAAQKAVLALMMQNGARLALPGEFTRRAFLNGRIDLVQAESVLDIIESESVDELACALSHTKGQLSARIGLIRSEVRGLLVEVEAQIDFPDEGLELEQRTWLDRLERAVSSLSSLVASFYEGRAIRQGLDVLILGRTNVGKSSLLNGLALTERAIVTPFAGTTRDLLEDVINIKGIKFRIIDTAGLRSPLDPIEKEGIDRVKKRIPEADICLWVLDASDEYGADDEAAWGEMEGKKVIAVLNKADLARRIDEGRVLAKGLERVSVSALTGSGLEELKEALYAAFLDQGHRGSGLLVTNVRHKDALSRCAESLGRARTCAQSGEPVEILAFELRDALSCLGEVTGETSSEDLLDQVFNRFCVGK